MHYWVFMLHFACYVHIAAQKKARKNSNIKRRLSLSSGNGNNKQILARY